MSLSSRKSGGCYNRRAQKQATYDAIADEFSVVRDPIEYEPIEHCECLYCNPPLGTLYWNRIVLMLFKLNAISEQMYFDGTDW